MPLRTQFLRRLRRTRPQTRISLRVSNACYSVAKAVDESRLGQRQPLRRVDLGARAHRHRRLNLLEVSSAVALAAAPTRNAARVQPLNNFGDHLSHTHLAFLTLPCPPRAERAATMASMLLLLNSPSYWSPTVAPAHEGEPCRGRLAAGFGAVST